MRTPYCLGFCFSTDHDAQTYVALIRKVKPDWQAGKLNGIGGKVEMSDGGNPVSAMVREFSEETGTMTDSFMWLPFAVMEFDSVLVYCFAGRMDWEKFESLRTVTAEEVVKIRVDRVDEFDPLLNLGWLIPMASTYLYYPTMARLWIRDSGIPAMFET